MFRSPLGFTPSCHPHDYPSASFPMSMTPSIRHSRRSRPTVSPYRIALRVGVVLVALCAAETRAANITWDGGGVSGTDWNTATNWGGDVLPTSADTVLFTSSGLPANTVVSLGANQTVYGLTFNPYSSVPTFTIGSAADITAGYTLTLTNVYRGDNNGGTQTIAANVKLAGNSTWNIVNGYSGSVAVSGSIGSDSSVILTKEGSNNLTLSGNNTFTGGVRVLGGSIIMSGTNAYTGATTASGGTVTLNFGAATTTDIINSGSALVLGGIRGGGSVTVTGRNLANVVNSQTFNGVTLNAGASTLTVNNGISSGKTLVSLGAITRNAGSTLNFVQPTTNATLSAQNGFTTSATNDASGILGAWATVGGTEYASNNGTNIVAYTGYTDQAGNVLADAPTTNLRITSATTGDITQGSGTTTVNTIRVNDAAARVIAVGTGNILRTNGILATGAGGLTIGASGDAGSLTAGAADNTAGELILNNSTAVTVNSVIANNGTGVVALTKSGAGTLTLGGTNTYTGGTFINAGTLALTAGSTDQLSTAGDITLTGGTFNLGAGTSQTTSGAVVIAGGTLSNGTLTKSGANFEVRAGTISTKLAGSAGLDKTTGGTLTFTNTSANTFTGDTTITEGSVVGSSAASVVSISGNLIVGSVSGGNAASYSNSGNNVNFASNKNVTVYSNGSVSFGGGAQNLSGTINIIGGSVSGSQIYNQGATYNLTGGSLTGTFYVQGGTYNILASASTATVGIGTNAGNQTFNVADGAAATDVAYTGSQGGSTNLTKTGAGLMRASGSSSYTGITTISGGTLSVTTLANGGSNSSIGAAAVAATNLRLGNDTVLQYVGTGHSTDRLFTVNGTAAGHSATLEASGTGAANFTNTGSVAWGTTNQTRTLKLGGTSTADNTLAALIANNGTGAVSLTKQDAGKWIITGANTYTGATTVNGGSLIVNGSLASGSAVTVNSGGTLGGSGTIGGSVTVNSGGYLSAGNSPGVLTVGSLSLGTGSTSVFEIGGATRGTEYDGVTVTTASGLTYGGALSMAFTSTLANDTTYDLFSFTGTAGGSFTSVVSTGVYAGTWTFANDVWTLDSNSQLLTFNGATGDITIAASSVPEPSAFALFGGVIALAVVAGRRSRRRA